MSTALCRGCGKMIEWVTMASGKRMPCDIEGEVEIPVEGAVVVSGPDNKSGVVVRGRVMLRTSHWATCPHAESFRRKGNRHE